MNSILRMLVDRHYASDEEDPASVRHFVEATLTPTQGNMGTVEAEEQPWHGQPASALLQLPPQGVLWLAPEA